MGQVSSCYLLFYSQLLPQHPLSKEEKRQSILVCAEDLLWMKKTC